MKTEVDPMGSDKAHMHGLLAGFLKFLYRFISLIFMLAVIAAAVKIICGIGITITFSL